MRPKSNPIYELEPRYLSPEEVANPIKVIQHFFGYAHLPQIREKTWELLKCAITGNYCTELSRRERSNLIHFFEELERLIEATHLIHQQKRKRLLRK